MVISGISIGDPARKQKSSPLPGEGAGAAVTHGCHTWLSLMAVTNRRCVCGRCSLCTERGEGGWCRCWQASGFLESKKAGERLGKGCCGLGFIPVDNVVSRSPHPQTVPRQASSGHWAQKHTIMVSSAGSWRQTQSRCVSL